MPLRRKSKKLDMKISKHLLNVFSKHLVKDQGNFMTCYKKPPKLRKYHNATSIAYKWRIMKK
mgnify:CR=1 FL=1